MKKYTTQYFIKKSKEAHGDKYDYSKVEYTNNHTKVCIICPEHGEFWQNPSSHLSGRGCPKCKNEKISKRCNKGTEQFIIDAKEIHGDKYGYSKVEYINNKTKVCIICPEHGEFWQTPCGHLQKKGCPKCAAPNRNMTFSDFVKKSNIKHKNTYEYDEKTYINQIKKTCIICKQHGEFWQTPYKHLIGQGCPKCFGHKNLTTEDFIKKAQEIHGNKYNYSKVKYVNYETKACIICNIHGEFWQTPDSHLHNKSGCPFCAGTKKLTTDEFIKKAQEIHGNRYDYSKVEYINNHAKVCIICPEHGEFWQTPNNHLKGKGCPICSQSKLERKVYDFLMENNIKFEQEKTFDWLKNDGQLRLDFYLPDYNIAIECQGEQHFKPIDFAGKGKEWAKKLLKENKKRDLIKKKLCEEHDIKIIYIPYDY